MFIFSHDSKDNSHTSGLQVSFFVLLVLLSSVYWLHAQYDRKIVEAVLGIRVKQNCLEQK